MITESLNTVDDSCSDCIKNKPISELYHGLPVDMIPTRFNLENKGNTLTADHEKLERVIAAVAHATYCQTAGCVTKNLTYKPA